ncbi:MAG: hypothetical protein P8127_03755 [Acidobacteriota bacterium]
MKPSRRIILLIIICSAALPAAAGELVLPVFALNLEGRFGDIWSSEIYLTNPGDVPVQVELSRFLPGDIHKPTPCDLFMPPTRVVPAHSAAVWTAAGLATDLGCAESARGGLVLRSDGPLFVTSRLVNLAGMENKGDSTILSGRGEAFEAIPTDDLPAAGSHLLPALMWHRNSCDGSDFDTFVGFTNPGPEPVEVLIDVPHEPAKAVRINNREVLLPHRLTVQGGSWRQFKIAPVVEDGAPCGGVESFVIRVEIDVPIAIYASVIDRKSGDPRTVYPVPLKHVEAPRTR